MVLDVSTRAGYWYSALRAVLLGPGDRSGTLQYFVVQSRFWYKVAPGRA